MAAIVVHYANEDLMDLRILKDKGGCNLIFDDRFHAEEWVMENDNDVDNYYRVVDDV